MLFVRGVADVDAVDYSYLNSSQNPNKNLLTKINYWQEGGHYAEFGYSTSGQATLSKHKAGSTNIEQVDFAQVSSTPLKIQTTNAHGKDTKYKYEDVEGMPRLTRVDGLAHGTCAASNSDYTYDSNGFYDQITDEEGNIVDYDFNDYGQLESITTGFGTPNSRTTSQTWNAIWDKVATVTTPLLTSEILHGFYPDTTDG
jgi:uncharacterized protein RhaS with RHS repeats